MTPSVLASRPVARSVVLGLAAVLLTACSGSGAQTATQSTASSSATGTPAQTVAPSVTPSGTATGAGPTPSQTGSSDPESVAARAAIQAAMKAQGTVRMAVDGPGQTLDGRIRFGDGEGQAARIELDAAGTKVAMILLADDLYVKLPLLGTDKWVHVTPDGTDPLSKQLAPLLAQSTDLADPLASTGDDGATMTAAGTVTEDGEELRLFDITSTSRDGSSGTARLYVGPDDLPRRAESTAEGTSITVTYSDWGAEVDISAPPAAEVVEAEDVGTAG